MADLTRLAALLPALEHCKRRHFWAGIKFGVIMTLVFLLVGNLARAATADVDATAMFVKRACPVGLVVVRIDCTGLTRPYKASDCKKICGVKNAN